jgi:hypothetical protein
MQKPEKPKPTKFSKGERRPNCVYELADGREFFLYRFRTEKDKESELAHQLRRATWEKQA